MAPRPVEEAEGYQRLVDTFSLTQQQVADVVGKDRSTVANMLRLLNLPASIRRMLQESQITLGHARALLAVNGERAMVELARQMLLQRFGRRQIRRDRLGVLHAERVPAGAAILGGARPR